MKVLIFAGAGTSVELGVPAMAGLAAEFRIHAQRWSVHEDVVRQLMGEQDDIEVLIENLDRICQAGEPLGTILDVSDSLAKAWSIRAEVEWFVQHACERIVPSDAWMVWSPLLHLSSHHEMTFVTTNYDRSIEIAANREHIRLLDGFHDFGDGELAEWAGFQISPGVPKLVKLHGSTDWFARADDGRAVKLRHPIPLFGRATLRLSSGFEIGSAMVLPSREKLLTRRPYPRLSQLFLNAADECDVAVFVGTSLRDSHIRSAAEEIAMTRPVFLVDIADRSPLPTGVQQIIQPAAEFLLSTLPGALRQSNVGEALGAQGQVRATHWASGMLRALHIATDVAEPTDRRCQAIEALEAMSISLEQGIIASLLGDSDATVARFALGLVPMVAAPEALFDLASRCAHTEEITFAEELELLKAFLNR